MKKLAFIAAVATLVAAPAFAQGGTGGGQRSGGPANELNPSGGMAPMGAPRATDNQPAYQTGSGQRAGGPANELNSSTGVPGVGSMPMQNQK